MTRYLRWLARERGLHFSSYDELWRWSITDLDGFWSSVWTFCDVRASQPYDCVLGRREMPGAEWFPGAMLNYAEHALRHERDGDEALMYLNERSPLTAMSWTTLGMRVRAVATRLRTLGVMPGDRVVAYLPNTPDTLIAMLATTSIGAIWSSCGPDFGSRGVLDRFTQLQPKVMICVDGYCYGGKPFDRREELRQILAQLPTVAHVIYVPYLDATSREPIQPGCLFWDEVLATPAPARADFKFEQLPFGAPLWILFSSGTTGLPKAIMHSHGGIILEQFKLHYFHMDVHPRQRMFFFTTTGWMMWNFLASALLSDVVPVLYDGNPAFPQPDVLWKMVEQSRASFFGASPTYQSILEQACIVPKDRFDLSALETVMLAGSPVTAECQQWFYQNVKQELWAHSGSGGTEFCAGLMGGVVTLPQYAGEIQARQLGVAAFAFDPEGQTLTDAVGELVITQPMPSMPIALWNDPAGSRYRESYFDMYPGIWRHGDFFRVNARGGCFVLGRSDATLNRHGVRIGTAEVYRSLLNVPEVEDAVIVNLDLPGGRFFMPLFVKIRDGAPLTELIADKIRAQLRKDYSPRHVPDKIMQVPLIPYTLTGKKLEVPVRRILAGVAVEKAANRAAMAEPRALDAFIDYAQQQSDYRLA
jgi:acetoacetyl-CoA synthetase